MKYVFAALVCLLIFAGAAWSQDTLPASDTDSINARIAEMEREIQELKDKVQSNQQPADSNAGGRSLALPDISLIVQAIGDATTDKKDPIKQKLQLTEAELGIQGYVYPNVKADAFIAASPAEQEPAQVEEAYLTYLGLAKGLNITVGQRYVPFDRVNQIHNHSWLYTRQPLAIMNLVASENLTGQGAYLSYLFPTPGSFFAQLDLGVWANGSEGEGSPFPEDGSEFNEIIAGPGANLTDRFETGRLWTGFPTGENGEMEIGGSWASGKSNEEFDDILQVFQTDHVQLYGADLTYRRFGAGASRLLLRGEHFWRKGTIDSGGATARGYYAFGDYRWDRYGHIGLLYDWTQFPQDVNRHESALSLILTKQFSEQYYLRLQAVRGDRPDCGRYNEVWLQWCWGVGPHSHNME